MSSINARIVNDKLMLFRVSLRNNKIISVSEKIKKSYITLLAYYLKDMDFSQNSSLYLFLNSYAEHINLIGYNFLDYKIDITQKDLKNHIKNISVTSFIKYKTGNRFIDFIPFLGIKKYDFRMYFLIELFFIRYLVFLSNPKEKKEIFIKSDIEVFSEFSNFNAIEKSLLNEILNILNDYSNAYDIANKIEQLIATYEYKKLSFLLYDVLNNIKIITNYMSLPIYNVGIFATMSAGKSTFVNALLDKDFIPAKNEACTAKITSISDNDSMDYKIFGGCSLDNRKNYMFSNNITNEVLENWNNDNRIDHIFLEADIKNIHSKNGILVIHDTPGPNNSRSEEHGLITKEFLEHNKDIDLFVYLINAEHATTEDNYDFMETIHEFFVKRKHAKIIFLLNKIDSFDTDKSDDIKTVINNVHEEIEKVGFKEPMIIPISANGARLFKKALHKEEMSKKEMKDFKFLFSLFNEEKSMDLPSYCNESILEMSYNRGYSLKEDLESEEVIVIDNENYSKKDLLKALDKTSINLVRSLLDKEIND